MNLEFAALGDNAEDLVTMMIAYLPNVLAAFAILIIGWMIAGWAKRVIMRTLGRANRIDPTIHPILGSVARYAILAVVLVAVLSQFGIQTASILAVLGAAGLAIGLALQGTLSNIAAGIMLLWLQPFRNGEAIETGVASGTVQEIGLFTTTIKTFDGVFQMVPNSELWNGNIINFSRLPTRRMEFVIGISYSDDVAGAKQVIADTLKQDKRLLSDPAPQIFLDNLGTNSLDIVVRVWASTPEFWAAKFDTLQALKVALEKAGYSFPFPQRELRVLSEKTQMESLS